MTGHQAGLLAYLAFWVFWVPLSACEKQQPEPVPPKPLPTIGPEPVPEPPEPPEPSEPSDVEPTCATACEKQRELGCVLGDPTPEGTSCEEVCQNSEQSGILDLAWDVEGLTEATTCTE